jgi:hypothetical protein
MFVLATLYAMMTLTKYERIAFFFVLTFLRFSWYAPAENFQTYNNNLASVWVKIISSWFCIAIYVWTCIAPALFPDRDFS